MNDHILEYSRDAMERGSGSFAAASRLFDRELREDVWLLYAWCRYCDDEIDGQNHGHHMAPPSPVDRLRRLTRLKGLTHAALSGEEMVEPAFAAFQRVALKHRFLPAWPEAMLDGFAMDVERCDRIRIEDTLEYCWCVAGVLGVMIAAMMGVRDPQVLRRAQDLGLAFQLTNICRDVREDAENGRLYLPADLIRRVGLEPKPTALFDRENQGSVFRVVDELLALAESYYRSARVGLRHLPFRSALAIASARGIYREIGRRILSRGPDALRGRTVVPKAVMSWQLLRGGLVAACSRAERLSAAPARPPLWSKI